MKRIPPCPLSHKNKQILTSVPSQVVVVQSKLLTSPKLDYSSMSNCEKPLVMKTEIKSSVERTESKDLKLKKKSVKQEAIETASITSIKEILNELKGMEEEILGEFLFATFSFDILFPEKEKDVFFFQNPLQKLLLLKQLNGIHMKTLIQLQER